MDTSSWQLFELQTLFNIEKGTRLTKADMKPGDIPFIGATAFHNGITAMIGNSDALHPANVITVSYNGSVGEAFYQESQFWASDDVNILYPKFELNRNIALFLIPLIRAAGKNYAFVNKWKIEDMASSTILLPTIRDNCPDWSFMETFIEKQLKLAMATITFFRPDARFPTFVDHLANHREDMYGSGAE